MGTSEPDLSEVSVLYCTCKKRRYLIYPPHIPGTDLSTTRRRYPLNQAVMVDVSNIYNIRLVETALSLPAIVAKYEMLYDDFRTYTKAPKNFF